MRTGALFSALFVLAACDISEPLTRREDATGPRPPVIPPVRTQVISCGANPCASPDRPWSWTVSIGMGTVSAIDSSAQQFSFPDRSFVRMTVTGMISRQYSPNISPSLNLAGTYYPPLDANGEWLSSTRSGFIFTAFSGTGSANLQALAPTSPGGNAPVNAGVASYAVEGPVRGTGRIRRWAFAQPSHVSSQDCWFGPCVIAVSGTQQVSLELASAQLILTASSDSVARGDAVTFTASSTLGNVTVLEWRWWPEKTPANTTVSGCGAATSCTVKVYESGTMWVRARTGPSPQTIQAAHAPVEAPSYPLLQCPTGDSVVDAPAMRALLRALMDSSMGHTPRREFAGILVRDSAGDERWVIDFANPGNSCTGSFYSLGQPAGTELLAFVHSHPYRVNQRTCEGTRYVSGWRGGIPSIDDWGAAATSGFAIPYVVIDADSIAVMRPGSASETRTNSRGVSAPLPDSSEFTTRYSGFSRSGPSCQRP